jgi:hypothetical protein
VWVDLIIFWGLDLGWFDFFDKTKRERRTSGVHKRTSLLPPAPLARLLGQHLVPAKMRLCVVCCCVKRLIKLIRTHTSFLFFPPTNQPTNQAPKHHHHKTPPNNAPNALRQGLERIGVQSGDGRHVCCRRPRRFVLTDELFLFLLLWLVD